MSPVLVGHASVLDVFERLTERARFVMVLAQEASRDLGHATIDTEHLLLGLLAERDGLASWTLKAVGVEVDAVYGLVGRVMPGSGSPSPGQAPFSDELKCAIELANVEVQRRHLSFIGTEHLLLGLLDQLDRAPARDVAARVLDELRVTTREIRETVERYAPRADGGLSWMLQRDAGALHVRGVQGAGWDMMLSLRAEPQLRRLYMRAAKLTFDTGRPTVEVQDLLTAFQSLSEGAELLRSERVVVPPIPQTHTPREDQDWTRIDASEEATAAAIGAERIAKTSESVSVTIRDLLVTLARDHASLLSQQGWNISNFCHANGPKPGG